MNRRNFLKIGSTGAAVLVAAGPLFAQEADEKSSTDKDLAQGSSQLAVNTEIGNNHGHALALTVDTVILAMQKARVDGSVLMNIQGQSGHPHSLSLTLDNLVDLLSLGTLTGVSSKDAGHTHAVKISLVGV